MNLYLFFLETLQIPPQTFDHVFFYKHVWIFFYMKVLQTCVIILRRYFNKHVSKYTQSGSLVMIFKDRIVLLWITLVLTYLLTYVLTYVLTYLRTSHLWGKSSYTKTYKTKNFRNYTSQCSKFFLFWQNPKNDQVRAKKRFWDLKI